MNVWRHISNNHSDIADNVQKTNYTHTHTHTHTNTKFFFFFFFFFFFVKLLWFWLHIRTRISLGDNLICFVVHIFMHTHTKYHLYDHTQSYTNIIYTKSSTQFQRSFDHFSISPISFFLCLMIVIYKMADKLPY